MAHRYELEAELGHGGTDMAWWATDALRARQVAVGEVDLPLELDAGRCAAIRIPVSGGDHSRG
jgi:hypothetical protein